MHQRTFEQVVDIDAHHPFVIPGFNYTRGAITVSIYSAHSAKGNEYHGL